MVTPNSLIPTASTTAKSLPRPAEATLPNSAKLPGQAAPGGIAAGGAKITTVLNLINQGLLSKFQFTEAQVQQATKATPQQQLILQQSNPSTAQQALSNSTLLKLNIQGQLLLAHSPLNLKAGQTVLLKLNQQGQLQIRLPAQTGASQTSPGARSPLNKAQMQSLQAALRQVLPQQQSTSTSLNSLMQLAKQPEAVQKQILNGAQRHTGQLLLQGLPSLKNMALPAILKNAIANSGVNQESQLYSLVKDTGDKGPTQRINLANQKTQLSRLASQLIGEQSQTARSPGFDPATTNLAKLLLSQSLSQSNIKPPSIDKILDQALEQLLKPALNQTQGQVQSQILSQLSEPQLLQLRQLIQRLLLNQSLGGLAKIQGQQLQGLVEQLATPSLLNRWCMELPFSLHQQVQAVAIDIQEHRQQKPRAEGEEQVTSLWQVRLSLELDDTGPLHAEIKLVGDRSEISLWFEQPQGLVKAKQQLQQLRQEIEAEGIELSGLQCFAGSPPQTGSLLQHHLINTKA